MLKKTVLIVFSGILPSLGCAGLSHIDGSNFCGAVTPITNLSADHPQVWREVFFIFDLGIATLMRMFMTVLFSGLHYYCRQQVTAASYYCQTSK